MSSSRTEAPAQTTSAPSTAIVLVNLGTPAAPTAASLRPYLREFLSDPRVVEIPRPVWLPLLHGIILRTRPAESAKKYARIWSTEGSPLKVHTERQAALLRAALAARGHDTAGPGCSVEITHAMRYGQPALASVIEAQRARGVQRILVLPLYPQYSASTTATVFDETARCLMRMRNQPEIRFVRDFHQHPGYIAALAASVRRHWEQHGQPEHLVMSFHGIPKRSLTLGDPYFHECQRSAQGLADALQLERERWTVTFQSRFGKAEWLQPYTQPTLEALPAQGVRKVDVICPGFVADCLETLEEIGMECRDAFLAAGGERFGLIPCLNEDEAWIDALADLCVDHAGSWLTSAR